MSGQWEVVGSKKNKQSKLPVPKGSEKQDSKNKNSVNGVKIEEVLPKSQVQNIYGNAKNIKDNSKPKEKSKPQEVKKPQKKAEKSQEPTKPKPPKSIESALNSINVEEFKSIFEKSKNLYPDTPIVWLKELVQFLNHKMPLELSDPVFGNKSAGFPTSVIPAPIRLIIEKSVTEAGRSNAQLFFDIALTSMATDMGKGLPAVGWRFFLQHIALNEPKLVTANINKHIILRNSYQNRSNIGLSIFWAVGQVGLSDWECGLKVFNELMVPLVEMKAYSRFVVKYLADLIESHLEDLELRDEEYFSVVNFVFSSKKNFPVDLRNSLSEIVQNLHFVLLCRGTKEQYNNYVDIFLKKIVINSNTFYQNCLSNALIEIFEREATALITWSKIYGKNVTASAVVLKYIYENWEQLRTKLRDKSFGESLNNIKMVNEELSTRKKKEESFEDAVEYVEKIQEKLVVKKKSSCSCSLFFVALLGILAVTFGPCTYKYLNEECLQKGTKSDVCYYTNVVANKSQALWVNIDNNIESQFPEYKQKINDISEPYVKLAKDLSLITYNLAVNVKEYAVEKYPVVVQAIDSYAPGLIEQSQKTAYSVWQMSVVYYTRGVDYLKNEVFVGQLSPENMQRAVTDALKLTQQKASEYISWLYEKVQTSIK